MLQYTLPLRHWKHEPLDLGSSTSLQQSNTMHWSCNTLKHNSIYMQEASFYINADNMPYMIYTWKRMENITEQAKTKAYNLGQSSNRFPLSVLFLSVSHKLQIVGRNILWERVWGGRGRAAVWVKLVNHSKHNLYGRPLTQVISLTEGSIFMAPSDHPIGSPPKNTWPQPLMRSTGKMTI